MISAKEAREKTRDAINNNTANELERIGREIEQAISKGYTSTSLGMISDTAEKYLMNLGYKVYTGSQYNIEYCTIEW